MQYVSCRMPMPRFRTLLAMAVALPALSGCFMQSLQTLRHTDPVDSLFHQELADSYRVFSEIEAENYDWFDSQYFAEKGLKAAYGKTILPENPENWNLPETMALQMKEAYELLLENLSPATIAAQPVIAARAIYSYDCWVEQQEENWQTEEITRCRDDFFSSVSVLQEVTQDQSAAPKTDRMPRIPLESATDKLENKTPKAPTPKKAASETDNPVIEPRIEEIPIPPAITEPSAVQATEGEATTQQAPAARAATYHLKFHSPQPILSPEEHAKLESIASFIKELEQYEVMINGYAGVSGAKERNLDMALKRAEMVKRAMTRMGVREEAINVFSLDQAPPGGNVSHGIVEVMVSGS